MEVAGGDISSNKLKKQEIKKRPTRHSYNWLGSHKLKPGLKDKQRLFIQLYKSTIILYCTYSTGDFHQLLNYCCIIYLQSNPAYTPSMLKTNKNGVAKYSVNSHISEEQVLNDIVGRLLANYRPTIGWHMSTYQ